MTLVTLIDTTCIYLYDWSNIVMYIVNAMDILTFNLELHKVILIILRLVCVYCGMTSHMGKLFFILYLYVNY